MRHALDGTPLYPVEEQHREAAARLLAEREARKALPAAAE